MPTYDGIGNASKAFNIGGFIVVLPRLPIVIVRGLKIDIIPLVRYICARVRNFEQSRQLGNRLKIEVKKCESLIWKKN